MKEYKDMNRKEKRRILFGKSYLPVKKIYKEKQVKNSEGKYSFEKVVVAYLHPTQGWIGNKKAVKDFGYKVKTRRTIA